MVKNGYLILPYSILFNKELKITEKTVLAQLISLSKLNGKCCASNMFLSERLGFSERTVSRSIRTLSDFGYIHYKVKENYHREIIIDFEKLINDNILSPDIPDKISKRSDNLSDPQDKMSYSKDKMSTYNNNYNNKYNNNYNNSKKRKSSYDINELMKIR